MEEKPEVGKNAGTKPKKHMRCKKMRVYEHPRSQKSTSAEDLQVLTARIS